jgi:hypothetical protein
MTEDELYQKLSDPNIPILEKKRLQEEYNHDHASESYDNSSPQSSTD